MANIRKENPVASPGNHKKSKSDIIETDIEDSETEVASPANHKKSKTDIILTDIEDSETEDLLFGDVKAMITDKMKMPEWHAGLLITLEPINIEAIDASINVHGGRSMPASMEENWLYKDDGKRFADVMNDIKHCVVDTTGKVGWKWAAYKEYSSSIALGVESRLISGCKLADIPLSHPMYAKVQQLVGMGLTERDATRSVFDLPRCIKATCRADLDGYCGLVTADLDICTSAQQSMYHLGASCLRLH